jgi:hypothetical protein
MASIGGGLVAMTETIERVEKEETAESPPAYRFFHLADARIAQGDYLLPTTGAVLFRGRLSSVSGFMVGSLKS